jgi:hypothetical protein
MPSPHASTEPETEADQQAQDAQYYRRILHGLIDMGADLARQIHQQALTPAETAEPGPEPAPDFTAAFDRIARTIRRSILLARKLTEPVQAPAANPAQHRVAARQHIIRAVEDTIQRNAAASDAESLHAEFLDRLDAPDLEDDIDQRPVADIIIDICRDLGLAALPGTHPWKRRTPADIAALCAHAAKPRAAVTLFAHPSPLRRSPSSAPALGSTEASPTRLNGTARLHDP